MNVNINGNYGAVQTSRWSTALPTTKLGTYTWVTLKFLASIVDVFSNGVKTGSLSYGGVMPSREGYWRLTVIKAETNLTH